MMTQLKTYLLAVRIPILKTMHPHIKLVLLSSSFKQVSFRSYVMYIYYYYYHYYY